MSLDVPSLLIGAAAAHVVALIRLIPPYRALLRAHTDAVRSRNLARDLHRGVPEHQQVEACEAVVEALEAAGIRPRQ